MTSDILSLRLPFRFLEEVGYIAPWFGIAWLVYDWGVKNNAYRKTKAGMIEYGEVTNYAAPNYFFLNSNSTSTVINSSVVTLCLRSN